MVAIIFIGNIIISMKKLIKIMFVIIGLVFISNGVVLAEETTTAVSPVAPSMDINSVRTTLPPTPKMGERRDLRNEVKEGIKVNREEFRGLKDDGINQIRELNQEQKEAREAFRQEKDKALEEMKNLEKGPKENREAFKEEREKIKDVLKDLNEKQKEIVDGIKVKREEFKNTIEGGKQALQTKVEAARTTLKEGLLKIKDEKKKESVEKISNRFVELNKNFTEKLSDKIDQIEGVLAGVKSRISKAEAKNINVTTAKEAVVKAEEAINLARASIVEQSAKVYTISIVSEETLKTTVETIKNNFQTDIKAVQDKVRKAHEGVVNSATTLAKIPKINDTETVVTPTPTTTTTTTSETSKVEETTTTPTTTTTN